MQRFSYTRGSDAASLSRSDQQAGQAYLAGGTTLLDLMKLDVMRPSAILDINDLAANHGQIESTPDGLRLGALVRMADAASHPDIARDYPVIAQSLLLAASAQIRNMA
ncbi:MAG TPA: FAD binding domain-containing protein, partial [Dongiaceae bacterium]